MQEHDLEARFVDGVYEEPYGVRVAENDEARKRLREVGFSPAAYRIREPVVPKEMRNEVAVYRA